jgi:MFS family permease
MFEEAAGLALVAGFYPPAMLVAAIYLGAARPGRVTAVYLLGGLLIVALIGTAALLAIRNAGLSLPGHHSTRYGLRLGLGVLALIGAIVLARRKPKPKPKDPAKPKKPSLIERMSSTPSPRAAFVVGILMFGPSVTFIAAVEVVATAKASTWATIAAMAMIFLLTLSFAWVPLVAYLIAPGSTVRRIKAMELWLRTHGKRVLIAAIGLIGLALVIQGVAGLS